MERSTKEIILEATIEVFREKGIKFTMDDVAKKLGMSKKTIYTVFREKEEMFLSMVDYLFDQISESKKSVLEDESLDTVGKIRKMFGVMPESYKNLDFAQLYVMKEKYPKIYTKVEHRLETGWEDTIALLQQGMREGVIREVNLPILKMMFESTLEQFFMRNILKENNLSYQDALQEVVSVLIEGIVVTKA